MYAPIFSKDFVNKCLSLYNIHFEKNAVYKAFCKGIERTPEKVKQLSDIPFLPIELFKNHRIYIGKNEPELSFKSSGTTQMLNRSVHYIDTEMRYLNSLSNCYKSFFTSGKKLSLYALLPGYIQNENSSLIYMLVQLNYLNLLELKGYYLHDYDKLINDLKKGIADGENILLWGVTFGLLDFAENHSINLNHHIVLETGGMKGRRREMTRNEVHGILKAAFNVENIYSEYGMTELLSQAYSAGNGIFEMNDFLKVMVRDVYDPLQYVECGKSGVLNIIDLNNEHSMPFIATQDLGRAFENQTFEVLGRTDNSDVRGCNLLAV